MKTDTTENEVKSMVANMATEIVDISKDVMNILNSGEFDTYKFGPHYVDTANRIEGIGELIIAILKNNGAVNPKDSHKGALRNVVIANSMFFADIEQEVRNVFVSAGLRYPSVTLRVYLSNHKRGYTFGNIQLTNSEDQLRPCPKPRAKYYVIE